MADVSKVTLPNGSSYDLRVYTDHISPMMSKTFTDVVGTANTDVGCTFFFGKVRPTAYYDIWKIKYRIRVHITGSASTYNQYAQAWSEVTWFGEENTYNAFHNLNQIHNTSYRPVYYNTIYNLKKAGFDAGLGHALGIGLRYSWNAYSASYPRQVTVQILQCVNCQFEFLDEMVPWTSLQNFNTTNYQTYRQTDFASNGLQETSDNNDPSYYNRIYYDETYTTFTALYRYQLLLTKSDTQLLPINTVNNSTANTKTLTTQSFNPFGEIFYWNTTTTYSAGAIITANALLYRQMYNFNLAYSFNTSGLLTAKKSVYIVAVLQEDGMAKLHTNPIAQDHPTTQDGLIYIYLGRAINTSNIELNPYHPVYMYKNGGVRTISSYAEYAGDSKTVNGHTVESDVPSNAKFTDTTYSAGTGLSLSGTTINHSNSVSAATAGTSSATSGSTLAVPYVTYDAQGHVTASGTHTHTVSGFSTTDTKNTAGSTDTSSKIFIVGATSQAANPQTYSQDTAYVGTDGHVYSNSKQVVNLSDSQALTNKTYNGYTLAAAAAKGVDTSIASGSTSTNLPTSKAVADLVSSAIAASDAMIFKGTIGTGGTVTALPTTYKTGWTYRVITAGTYAGNVCEVGDLIIALVDRSGSGNVDADWTVAQTNVDGAITKAGGTINGVLTVDNELYANSASVGNLVVTGDATFTNDLRGNLIGTVNGSTPIKGGSNAASAVTITPSTTDVYSMTSTGSVTAGTATTPAVIDTSKFSGGSFTRGTFSGGSFTQGTDSFTANTPTVINTSKFNGGSFTRGTFSGGSFTQGTDSFTANTPTAINTSKFSGGSFTRGTFSGGSLTMAVDSTDTKQLNITFTAATHAADSFTPASLQSGFYTAGTAATFSQGTDSFTAATHAADSFTAASLGSGFYTAGTAASFTQGTDSFTAATHAADSFTPASLQSGFYTAGTKGTPTAVTLPGRSSAIKAWTGYSAATAAAQTFTGTPC